MKRIFPTLLLLALLSLRLHAQSWTNRFDSLNEGFCEATAMVLNEAGDVFVTGSATGFSGSADFATVAYSSSGAPLWTNWYNGAADERDGATAIAIGPSGSIRRKPLGPYLNI